MGYTHYRDKFNDVRHQHNILALVGNGFDIQILSRLGSKMDTRYESFYYYLKSRNFDRNNHLMKVMEDEKRRAGRSGATLSRPSRRYWLAPRRSRTSRKRWMPSRWSSPPSSTAW